MTDLTYGLDDGWDLGDDDPACTICGGEPWATECDDPIQCCKRGCDGVSHGCDACGDTGLAKHQTMW